MYQKSSLSKSRLKQPSLLFEQPPCEDPSYDSWIFKNLESAYKSQFIDDDEDEEKRCCNYEQQIVATLIKLLLHITLISIFETLFYFLYVSSLENNGIENAINTFINGAIED